ncbi:hypothetical protein EV191_1011240 [Tamaricihabitans halophyticus]|uniref:Protein phosphatase 2C-like protein n=1 Tax=Tamaricihabitans halophyticus TaxID=1262583 RepID=A0A4V2SV69_9PSEU|nr:hypothetical protein [Tamaricihabitans halophyticus]TCP57286.1 hypothetical protein EV191_1011240 [Tamaricihabitans halophyticus]
MQVTSAQLPAIEDSDDKIFTTPNAVIMLDGASAFLPVPTAANLYADHLGRTMREHLAAEPAAPLRTVLAEAIGTTAAHFDLAAGTSPSSAVTIARIANGELELLLLGDNMAILPGEFRTDDRMDHLNLAPRRRYRERLAAGTGYDTTHKELLRELQQQQAALRNVDGGYWIAETNPYAARQALISTHPLDHVPWLILATDGAYNTMTHLGLTDWPRYARADHSQLASLLHHCQQWESHHDPQAQALPRAKRHDDKSIAAIATP